MPQNEKDNERRISSAEIRLLRRIAGQSNRERIRNEDKNWNKKTHWWT